MQKNSYSGKFIVFEGLDGSGQSTQAGLLRDYLARKDYQVVLTKEPTKNSEAGQKIRQILDKRITGVRPRQLQKLFAEDRKEHLEKVIIPALKEGKIVISDRYFFSSLAYGTSSGVDLDWLIKINNQFLLPDLTIILRVAPEICLQRIEKRGNKKTLFEEKEKLTKVWQIYQLLPKRFENVYIIDGERSIEEIFKEIQSLVHSKLNL